MSDQKQAGVTFTFDGGAQRSFSSPGRVRDYLVEERQFWTQLLHEKLTPLQNYGDPQLSKIVTGVKNEVTRICAAHIKTADNDRVDQAAVALLATRQDVLIDRMLSRDIPADMVIDSLIHHDPMAALAGLIVRIRSASLSIVRVPDHLQGAVVDGLARYSAATQMTVSSMHAAIQAAKDTKSNFEQITEGGMKLAERLKQAETDWARNSEATITAFKLKADKKLDELEGRSTAFLQLKLPIEYWDEQAKAQRNHKDTSRKNFRKAVRWVAIAAIGVIGMMTLALAKKWLEPQHVMIFTPPLVVIAIAVLWDLRYRAREYLDAAADLRDAEQRKVQLQTYVAMAKTSADPQERTVALTALFRPGPSQTADDGIPLPLIELIKARGQG